MASGTNVVTEDDLLLLAAFCLNSLMLQQMAKRSYSLPCRDPRRHTLYTKLEKKVWLGSAVKFDCMEIDFE